MKTRNIMRERCIGYSGLDDRLALGWSFSLHQLRLATLRYQGSKVLFDVVGEIVCECVETALSVAYLLVEERIAKAEWLDRVRGDSKPTNDLPRICKSHQLDLADDPTAVQIVVALP